MTIEIFVIDEEANRRWLREEVHNIREWLREIDERHRRERLEAEIELSHVIRCARDEGVPMKELM